MHSARDADIAARDSDFNDDFRYFDNFQESGDNDDFIDLDHASAKLGWPSTTGACVEPTSESGAHRGWPPCCCCGRSPGW